MHPRLFFTTPSSGFCHSALDVPHSILEVYYPMQIEPDSLPTGHAGIAARLKKGPTVHSSAWIVPGATVIGDVTIEEESSVWYGAVLRGDINRIIIGPRSNVQDNAVVHSTRIIPQVWASLSPSATAPSSTLARSTMKFSSGWAPSFSTMWK